MVVSVRLTDLVCPGSRLAVLNTNREIHRIAWRWQAQNFGRQRYQDGGQGVTVFCFFFGLLRLWSNRRSLDANHEPLPLLPNDSCAG